MARPRKWRKVCSLPQNNRFGPMGKRQGQNEKIYMSVDQYETIRLIDLENMTQEECANQMNIARTTVQRIYSEARKVLADSLVNGKEIIITGGDYKICDGNSRMCGKESCNRSIE